MSFLELRGVGKAFGPPGARHEVLRAVRLSVERGEFVAIVGPSGAGKTTLVSLLAGLERPDAGVVRVAGRPVERPGRDRGVVFQTYALLPWLSVVENVALAVGSAFPDWPAERRRAQVERYVALVGLSAARDKRPAALSGGMRQRVALARALAMEPEVLLLDEPLGALDALTRATMQTELARIWSAERRTVVMVTNDVDEAILLADRIVPLGAGPGATLGAPIAVPLDRPRERKALLVDPGARSVRAAVVRALSSGRARTREVA